MGAKGKKKSCYAFVLEGGRQGVVGSWNECRRIVEGRRARYKGFFTLDEAYEWLESGAEYRTAGAPPGRGRRGKRAGPQDLPDDAVYFDSGTGRGKGTEVSVTDRDGVPLAHLVVSKDRLTRWGTVRLSRGRTNNYGELLACLLAIRAAKALGHKRVMGDSRLVLDYWSRNLVSRTMRMKDPDLVKLAGLTAAERDEFEAAGGILGYVPGRVNPADLGFHRD